MQDDFTSEVIVTKERGNIKRKLNMYVWGIIHLIFLLLNVRKAPYSNNPFMTPRCNLTSQRAVTAIQ